MRSPNVFGGVGVAQASVFYVVFFELLFVSLFYSSLAILSIYLWLVSENVPLSPLLFRYFHHGYDCCNLAGIHIYWKIERTACDIYYIYICYVSLQQGMLSQKIFKHGQKWSDRCYKHGISFYEHEVYVFEEKIQCMIIVSSRESSLSKRKLICIAMFTKQTISHKVWP